MTTEITTLEPGFGCAPYALRDMGRAFDEERREVFESVLVELAYSPADPDRTAACVQLLRHLARPVHPG